MKLFQQKQQNAPQDPKSLLTAKYNAGRNNLLLVAIFTIVNVILLITNSDLYFLFSASIPYIIADLFMDYCGMYPAEYYEYWYEEVSLSELEFLPPSVFAVGVAIALIFALVYVLFYFLSKNGKGAWLIASLVFFCIDTVVMFIWYGFSSVIDAFFHVWVIVILSMAVRAHFKLKALPSDDVGGGSGEVDVPVNSEAEIAVDDTPSLDKDTFGE